MKKIICILLSVCVLLVGLPFVVGSASGTPKKGKIGKNINWKYESETKTLYLSGKGITYNFDSGTDVFTNNWNKEVKKVIVGKGITKIGDGVFEYNYNIKNVKLPNTLKSIGYEAFSECKSLIKINFPKSLEIIEESAFYNCLKLEKIILPEGLKEIGDCAFEKCISLLKITIPKSVKRVGKDSFYDCPLVELCNLSRIKKVKFKGVLNYYTDDTQPSKIVRVKDFVFLNLDKKTYLIDYRGNKSDIILPSSVQIGDTLIENYFVNDQAFLYDSLSSIELPKAVSSIGKDAFSTCNDIKSIKFNEGLIEIGDYAFCGLRKIKTINLPDSLINIGTGAFCNSEKLVNVNLGTGLKNIGNSAFSGTIIKKLNLPNSLVSIGDDAFSGIKIQELSLPNSIKSIGDCAFSSNYELLSVDIPQSLISFGKWVFDDCIRLTQIRNLSNVFVPQFKSLKNYITNDTDSSCIYKIGKFTFSLVNDKVEIINIDPSISEIDLPLDVKINENTYTNYEIAKGAFSYRDNLEYIKFANNVTKIGEKAFFNCISLTTVLLPKGLKSIGKSAFAFSGIEKVVLEKSIEYIGSNAFEYCEFLEKIEFFASVDRIREGTFYDAGFEKITLPKNIKVIGESAFSSYDLKEIKLNSGLTKIKKFAFSGSSLKTIITPNTVEIIEKMAFLDCENLKSVKLSKKLKEISEGLFYDSGLKSVNIPNSVERIGYEAFKNCSKLNKVKLSKSLKVVSNKAFINTGLVSVSIPSSVKKINYKAFAYCKNLVSFTVRSKETQLMKKFVSKNKNLIIYGKADSKAQKYAKQNKIKFAII